MGAGTLSWESEMCELVSRAAHYEAARRERFESQGRPVTREHRVIRSTRGPHVIVACDWSEEYGETRLDEAGNKCCPFCAAVVNVGGQ